MKSKFPLFLLFFLAFCVSGNLPAQAPVPEPGPSKNDALIRDLRALAPARRAAPPLPGTTKEGEDIIITRDLGDNSPETEIITNQAELDLILKQLREVHGLSPARAAAIQGAYDILFENHEQLNQVKTQPNVPRDPESLRELPNYLMQRLADTVPDLNDRYPEDELGDEFDPLTLKRRDAEGIPNTSLILRRYAGRILGKYDTNRDGKLEQAEWEKMPGKPQAYDLNGDFVLEDYEILYALAAYAKGRTISHPIPPRRLSAAQTVLKTDGPILIQPLSGPIRKRVSDGEEETDPAQRPSDISPEEFESLLADADEGAGTEDQSELFGVVTQETGPASPAVREYAPSESETEGIPRWFLARDANGDGQLSLREFAPTLSLEATAFFGRLDADGDGLVTPDEVREFLEKGPRPKKQAAQ